MKSLSKFLNEGMNIGANLTDTIPQTTIVNPGMVVQNDRLCTVIGKPFKMKDKSDAASVEQLGAKIGLNKGYSRNDFCEEFDEDYESDTLLCYAVLYGEKQMNCWVFDDSGVLFLKG